MFYKNLLIAIDGPSSSGKGTIAKKIASHFQIPCLNTGGLYRAIAFLALSDDLDLEKDQAKIIPLCGKIIDMDLESPNLHNEQIGKAASTIAANHNIRKAIFDLQRNFAIDGLKEKGGAVLEGRDIGTVICPDANYKFFITAAAEVRARRRYEQLSTSFKESGQEGVCDANYDLILEQLKKRDWQDQNRQTSPLKKAVDAIEIDSSKMNIKEVFDFMLKSFKD